MNWYEVLEVSPSASPQVIRAAYKSLMQRYHPDKAPADAQRATQLAQAYAVLSDAGQRQAYDQQLQRLAATAPAAPPPRTPHFHRPVQRPPTPRAPIGLVGWIGLCGMVLGAGGLFKAWVLHPPATMVDAGNTPALAAPRARAGQRVHLHGLVVPVRAQSPALTGEPHILTVPTLVLELGPWQVEQAAWRLGHPSSTDALQAALAPLGYEALIAHDGQATLIRALHDAANTVLGPPTQPPPRNSMNPASEYGVVSVVLPDAFSVR